MIDTVLIPVDGSPGVMKALKFGGDLAARYGARVILLHVLMHENLSEAVRGLTDVERSVGNGLEGLTSALDRKTMEELEAARRAGKPLPPQILEFIATRVTEIAERAVRRDGIADIRIVIEDGDPARRILECAERENADLIVMGARGLSSAEALILGSVSQKVAHLARCTCITVR